MKKFIWIVPAFLLIFNINAFAGVKKLAVLDFEDASITATPDLEGNPLAAIALLRGQNPPTQDKGKIGKSVANILVTELVKDGTYKIVERNQLESILSEQKLGQSMLSASEAAKIGKILGVSTVIIGSVTEFNTKTEKRGVLGIGTKVKIASVAINARIVDTATSEILFAAEGTGREEEGNVIVGSLYGSDTTGASEALLTAATKKAAAAIIQTIKENSAKLKEQVLEGFVVHVDTKEKSIMVDLGSDSGLTAEQPLYVIKIVKEIKNQSGEVIKRITEVIGELKVRELEKKVATCVCVDGSFEDIKEGDKVSSAK